MLTAATTSPEFSTFREVENLLRSHNLDLSGLAYKNGAFHARVRMHDFAGPTTHRGRAPTLQGAVTAAFEAFTRNIPEVLR